MNRRLLKNDVLNLLQKANFAEILPELEKYPANSLLNPLFLALCDPVERARWNAVLCFGWLVPAMAEKEMEAARIVMRRFLWSLNDESGGIGWGSPEAMGEIMCHNPRLRHEYLHMLISYMREDGENLFEDGNYLELPLLQRGLLWGIGRLCQEHQKEMLERGIVADLRAYLKSSDMHVVGLAIRCLGLLGVAAEIDAICRFETCQEPLRLFIDNEIKEISVAELVRQALGVH
ncbi:HEAT repeat domain-containing protein [Desulfopila sp. IMCC35006]|uniref:DVU0298 family protein n=1 Tax=Desulfopila sp. IMCC35006 TaxID=2569542 RepID=UPI0010AC1556|nr:DVU0298 family protein [Desulfopila sp. IMCC35006]TKB27636.1 HEAT repeat domain-containing protein [Desulfopila sp. IMCC35006]